MRRLATTRVPHSADFSLGLVALAACPTNSERTGATAGQLPAASSVSVAGRVAEREGWVAPTVQRSASGLRASCLPHIPCSASGLRAERGRPSHALPQATWTATRGTYDLQVMSGWVLLGCAVDGLHRIDRHSSPPSRWSAPRSESYARVPDWNSYIDLKRETPRSRDLASPCAASRRLATPRADSRRLATTRVQTAQR